MDFTRHFHEEIQRRYSPQTSQRVLTDLHKRYQSIYPDISFARKSSNPMDRRLEFCAYFLATIQALAALGASFEEIRLICVSIAESYVRPANAWQAWLKRLPGKFMGTPIVRIVARIMAAKTGKKGHPDGFLVHIVTDPLETNGLRYGFDILECGICTLFRKHGALAYVPILCEVDRLTSSMAGLEMIRAGTIALGAERCDFRFRILR